MLPQAGGLAGDVRWIFVCPTMACRRSGRQKDLCCERPQLLWTLSIFVVYTMILLVLALDLMYV